MAGTWFSLHKLDHDEINDIKFAAMLCRGAPTKVIYSKLDIVSYHIVARSGKLSCSVNLGKHDSDEISDGTKVLSNAVNL